jgi:hypothetical protein
MPKEYIKLYCTAKDLEKKDGVFGKSGSLYSLRKKCNLICTDFNFRKTNGKKDPFVTIRTSNGKLVGKSEIVQQNLYPTWKPFLLDVTEAGGE